MNNLKKQCDKLINISTSYICYFCGKKIKKKTTCYRRSYKSGNVWINEYYHPECLRNKGREK